jgi:hypothetical protein
MMWSTTTSIGCGTTPGPRYQITSCRYRAPGKVDGQLAYPGADTLQVSAAPAAVATPESAVVPSTAAEPTSEPAAPPTTEGAAVTETTADNGG